MKNFEVHLRGMVVFITGRELEDKNHLIILDKKGKIRRFHKSDVIGLVELEKTI